MTDFYGDPVLGRIVGDCQIEALAATGGQGSVYRAIQRRAGFAPTTRAIKLVRFTAFDPPSCAVADLRREHTMLRELNRAQLGLAEHGLHEVRLDQPGNEPLLAVALTLDWIADPALTSCPPELDWPRLGANLLRAVSRLHEQGFVHGDLTPEHIRVSRDAQVTLIDYGAAVRIGEPPVARTPKYASRALDSKTATAATDVFACLTIFREFGPWRAFVERSRARRALDDSSAERPTLTEILMDYCDWGGLAAEAPR